MVDEISYYETRMMHQITKNGADEYAIHDVYFRQDGKAITWTVDALSPRENSVEALKIALWNLLAQPGEKVTCGDLQYPYDKEDIKEWLIAVDLPVIDETN